MEKDFSNITKEIHALVQKWQPVLESLDTQIITGRRNKQNRTIKQLLGHLVDSASNNHQRIVRLQYNEQLAFPDYQKDNDLWISLQDYQHYDWPALVLFWKHYNLHMAWVIKSIDCTKLNNFWINESGEKITLAEMVEGYLSHLQLHLNDIEGIIKS